jgi:mycothiol synthase
VIPLPDGYTSRPPTRDDAPAVADLIAAADLADMGTTGTNVDEVLADWESTDLGEEAIAVFASDGWLAAYADLVNHEHVSVTLYGYVHPEHRGRGLGSWLLGWGEQWAGDRMHLAPQTARVTIEQFAVESNQGARDLLLARGYTPVRVVHVMEITLDQPLEEPIWPEGVRARPIVLDRDEFAAYEANEDAFKDHWNHPPTSFGDWLENRVVDFRDPGLCLLAEDEGTGEIVGTCFCRVVAGSGWISSVGVRRAWRRRGLGLAMLRHTLLECQKRGARDVSLSVDSQSLTGAPRVYQQAGMRVARSYIFHQKELRAGENLSLNPAVRAT